MTNKDIVSFLNGQWPPSVETLNGQAISFCQDTSTLVMHFDTRRTLLSLWGYRSGRIYIWDARCGYGLRRYRLT